MNDISHALLSLREFFGFADFREGQREVIAAVLEQKDVVVVMPTGSGKSLCYQLPALMLKGATIVVSPLIALMKDQVDALKSRGLPATFINSSIDEREQWSRIEALRRGQFKLVYVAPERFRSQRFLEALQSISISLFAVDEAHCISTWGHDFRPDYLRLNSVVKLLGNVRTLALTATATPYVRSDIIQQLGLKGPETFVSGFDRPNLTINVVHTEKEREKISRIRKLAKIHDGSGIIYASTRKAVEQVADELREYDMRVTAYHAGMTDLTRIKAQEEFMTGNSQMIVATNAFGMGIDKPDIRFVVHYQMPGSIEAYYQEIGRAGRDGLPSTCLLLFNYADKNTHDFFIDGSYPSVETVRDIYNTLVSTGLKRIELSSAEIVNLSGCSNEMAVQSSLYLLERAGHIERSAASDHRICVRLSKLNNTRSAIATVAANRVAQQSAPAAALGSSSSAPSAAMSNLLSALQHHYAVTSTAETELDIRGLVRSLGADESSVRRTLNLLENTGARIKPDDVARRAALERSKLREIIEFCYTSQCYRAHILNYFGDRHHAHYCGRCGNCLPKTAEPSSMRSDLLEPHSTRRRRGKGRLAPIFLQPRALSEDETLRVRKILACATRMKGRFGKHMVASTLRGSAAKNLTQARLNELSTYGILKDMRQDAILSYIEALINAGCLRVTSGEYPTISITELGERVMREQERIILALPDKPVPVSGESSPTV